jgi:hypothetical protein
MTAVESVTGFLPNNLWYEGRVLSWESSHDGHRMTFELIPEPETFYEKCRAEGDEEIIELYEPSAGHRLTLTMLDENDKFTEQAPIELDANNPSIRLAKGSRFIMDGLMSDEPNLAYTCVLVGQKPIVS